MLTPPEWQELVRKTLPATCPAHRSIIQQYATGAEDLGVEPRFFDPIPAGCAEWIEKVTEGRSAIIHPESVDPFDFDDLEDVPPMRHVEHGAKSYTLYRQGDKLTVRYIEQESNHDLWARFDLRIEGWV